MNATFGLQLHGLPARGDTPEHTHSWFTHDLLQNYEALKPIGIDTLNSPVFLPPYEWYNNSFA
jgi:hypothetical protein